MKKFDCFLVCFSLQSKKDLEKACEDWKSFITEYGPENCPQILVGLKKDARNNFVEDSINGPDESVTTTFGREESQFFQFDGYIECSAKTKENVEEVFIEAIKAVKSR